LRIAIDFDFLESKENPVDFPVAVMRGRIGWYDLALLDVFAALHGESNEIRIVELRLRELATGMIFAEDLKSQTGLLLVARGQEVTAGLLECLQNIPAAIANRQIVRMIASKAAANPVLADAIR
jgi:hypothetical protein